MRCTAKSATTWPLGQMSRQGLPNSHWMRKEAWLEATAAVHSAHRRAAQRHRSPLLISPFPLESGSDQDTCQRTI